MEIGASGGRRPLSLAKNTKYGNLIPACRKTPADAICNTSHAQNSCSSAAPLMIIDLLVNPLVNGTAEIASAPIVPRAIVQGMLL